MNDMQRFTLGLYILLLSSPVTIFLTIEQFTWFGYFLEDKSYEFILPSWARIITTFVFFIGFILILRKNEPEFLPAPLPPNYKIIHEIGKDIFDEFDVMVQRKEEHISKQFRLFMKFNNG